MEKHIVKILETGQITHDVRFFRVERPEGYTFIPGQATDVSVNTEKMKDEKRAFTFTNLISAPYIEFIIKRYPSHKGVTDMIHQLKTRDELILHEVFGDISYKGKGLFIAGGAGITPFISILRDLKKKNEIEGNRLIFANKTRKDIILERELSDLLGKDFINILSEEKTKDYQYGFINEDFLKSEITDYNQKFYLCGPPPMIESVLGHLAHLGVSEDSIIMEPM
jgi:ferredoxin-NADP reductase